MAFGRPKDGVFFVARGSTPYVVPYKRRKNGLWATTRGGISAGGEGWIESDVSDVI
jgi:hypothetical protein